jgi:hypothetical protein
MSDLSPDTRALLDAARDAHDPSADDRARIRGKLTAQLGAAAFAGTAVTAATTTGRAAVRLGFGAAVVGAAALAIWMWGSKTNPPAPQPSAATTVAIATPAPQPTVAPDTVDLDPTPVPVESLRAVQPTIKQVAPAPTEQSTLEAELALLRDAKKALNDGDANRCLALLDDHQKRFPSGVLGEESAATRVLALCSAGRTTEATVAAKDFLGRYPKSPSAPRVRSSCGGSSP